MVDSLVAALGIYAAALVIGVLSGLVPLINGEVALIVVVLATGKLGPALALAVLVAAGQMIAKIVLYQTARGASELRPDSKLGRRIAHARERIARWNDKPLLVTFVSAITGLPPFYLVTLLAGALGVRFRTFLVLGIIGRVVRFVAIALIVLWV